MISWFNFKPSLFKMFIKCIETSRDWEIDSKNSVGTKVCIANKTAKIEFRIEFENHHSAYSKAHISAIYYENVSLGKVFSKKEEIKIIKACKNLILKSMLLKIDYKDVLIYVK